MVPFAWNLVLYNHRQSIGFLLRGGFVSSHVSFLRIEFISSSIVAFHVWSLIASSNVEGSEVSRTYAIKAKLVECLILDSHLGVEGGAAASFSNC